VDGIDISLHLIHCNLIERFIDRLQTLKTVVEKRQKRIFLLCSFMFIFILWLNSSFSLKQDYVSWSSLTPNA